MTAPAIRPASIPQTYTFSEIESGHYQLTIMPLGIQFDIDRLRREHGELKGELCVRCDFAKRSLEGVISIGDWNISTDVGRYHRAQALNRHAPATGVDWHLLLDEFAHRILMAEREGQPARLLSSFQRRGPDAEFQVERWPLLRDHATIAFGDGGSAKSYLALYIAGHLVLQGHRILYVDWELEGEDHRDRLERMFGPDMPALPYIRCDRPLVYEVDRIQRDIRRFKSEYLICDSIGFATPGPPEAAEHAMSYFRALRQLHIGSLNLAHVNKSEGGDQKPFGSAFWHNSARATWFIKQAETGEDETHLTIGLFNRKSNLSRRRPAIGFAFEFSADSTVIRPTDPAEIQDLAAQLPMWARARQVLKSRQGVPLTLGDLAEHLGEKEDSVKKAVYRKRSTPDRRSVFAVFDAADGRTMIGLS